jgi:P-type Cu2+ transporter
MVASAIKQQTFPVLEMTCASCAVSVESMLKAAKGVKEASVNYANQTALVKYDATATTETELQTVVRSIGYDLVVNVEDPTAIKEEAQQEYYQQLKSHTVWSAVLAVPVVVIGMFLMNLPYGNYTSMALSAPVVFYFGRMFFVNGWKQAKHGKANMDTLVALSTGIAFLFSAFNTFFPEFWHARGIHAHVYYEASAVIVVFILLGKLLEEKAKSKTSSAIKKLIGLQPKTVNVIVNGSIKEIAIAEVKVGDVIQIHPGEKIPVDSIVVQGSSYVDESMISGEPVAVAKLEGAKVFAGTVNQKGSLQLRAEKVGSATILAQIIKMVQEAQGSKAPVQKTVDKIAAVFVPVVIGISILTFILWMILGGESFFAHALLASVTVLVIACPCALGLATPTAIMVGVGKGAEQHILIKDAESLEQACQVNAVVLDKTGTITEGKPEVTSIAWLEGLESKEEIKKILYSLEVRSEHPLAEAISNHLSSTEVAIADFKSLTGKGVEGKFQNEKYFVGNPKLMQERNIMGCADLDKLADEWLAQAQTVIWFADSKKVLAVIGVQDKIKASSKNAIMQLQHRGIEVHMLTGDNATTTQVIAQQAGIKNYKAEILPNEKAEYVKQLQSQGKIVAMVGDGINDSQALAQADVSIAMGKGSDIAIDVAKMTLITSDLQMIPRAFDLSTKTVRTIRQNLFWAFIYNLIGIPLAAGILFPVNGFLLNPMIASAAMALSSVSVVSNSLRLRATNI